MTDPTYDKEAINANPVWQLAFLLSEIQNDNAPIGWGDTLRVSQLPRASGGSTGGMMDDERVVIEEQAGEVLKFDGEDGRVNLSAFQAWFAETIKDVPEGHKAGAFLHVRAMCWDEARPDFDEIALSYTRPETDAEFSSRLEQDRLYRIRHEEQERATYEALKRKFE